MVVSSMQLMEDGANAAPTITYDAIKRDHGKICKLGFKGCLPPPSNKYDRGCERFNRCRGGGGRKLMAITL
ncbi:hypothetical protein F3Y22_tig00111151pilonHSYRG00368 [Hibiscus syriacus]|uniref:Uncharacterized protein n=1 Tax=Hibiscus syriacus TaxID=106335 RepID=A0A6A2YY51_HIBSY|nr:hypothetical protein F3Y22_tig00111151pilonHSYRG00368 [Hibiscus syriacus]